MRHVKKLVGQNIIQLLNQRSIDPNFNIMQYEKQSASFIHHSFSKICCLCVVKCVVGGAKSPQSKMAT